MQLLPILSSPMSNWTMDQIHTQTLGNAILGLSAFIIGSSFLVAFIRRWDETPKPYISLIVSIYMFAGSLTRLFETLSYYYPVSTGLAVSKAITGLLSIFTAIAAVRYNYLIAVGINRILNAKEAERKEQELLVRLKVAAEAEAEAHRYRLLANSIPQIVWTATPGGDVDYFNKHWYEYTGEIDGQSLGWGWRRYVHALDLPGCLEVWTRSIETKHHYEFQYRILRHDGVYRWHLVKADAVQDENGQTIKWFGTFTDIDDHLRNLVADRYPALGELRNLLRKPEGEEHG